jgi:hypothetical protein
VISQGSQFGLGTWLLKYSREYEKQADLLGAQIMARAGYDPRDLGRMFETIQKQGGNGAPQWMSSHPDPGNRSSYIAREADALHITRIDQHPEEFKQALTLFKGLPPAKSMAELEKRGTGGGSGSGGGTTSNAPVGRIGGPVPAPSSEFRTVQGGKLFEASVPSNWTAVSSNNAVKFVPENGYGVADGNQTVFTHGIEFGVSRASSSDLNEATRTLINAFARSNPDLRAAGNAQNLRISQRNAIGVPLTNRGYNGRGERIGIYTTFLTDGNLFYLATIVPDEEASQYGPVFDRIARSIRLKDVK